MHRVPAYCMHGIRCKGGKIPGQASLGNVRTCFQHALESRDGHARSSDEAAVMAVERRGMDHRPEHATTRLRMTA